MNKIKAVKVETDSSYDWKFTIDREINIKRFVSDNIKRFNTGEVVRVDTPARTQCYIITR